MEFDEQIVLLRNIIEKSTDEILVKKAMQILEELSVYVCEEDTNT